MELYTYKTRVMNRLINKILLLILATTLIVACSKREAECEPIWNDATIVAYANIGQLHSKGDIANLNLSTICDSVNEQDKAKAKVITAILHSPDTSGIAIDKPAYIAIKECDRDLVAKDMHIALEISDVAKLDATLKSFVDDFNTAELSIKGEKRIIDLDANTAIGYDSKRLIIIYRHADDNNINLRQEVSKYLDYLPADMSRFGNQDVAIYLDIDKFAKNFTTQTSALDEDEETQSLECNEPYSQYFEEQASAIIGLKFKNGAIALSTDCEGVSEELLSKLKRANTEHIKLLEPSPIALLNAGINGEAIAELLDIAFNTMIEEGDIIGANNELNIYKNIALGVVSSIDGNLMLALSEANGKLIDDIIDGKKLVFTTANALFTADVKDDYIMQNAERYGNGILTKGKNNTYSLNAFGNKINIGQKEQTFYLGINNSADEKSASVADQEWSNDILGSYLYAMIDFNKLFKSSFGTSALTNSYNNINDLDTRKLIKLITSNVNCLYILLNGDGNTLHSEWKLMLNDIESNALKLIVNTVYEQA